MSVKVMSWVWESSQSKGIDRLVLLAIADWAWDDGSNAYPSIPTIAKKTKVTDRTVQRSIQALIELGELTAEKNAGRKGTNMYRVVMHSGVNVSPPDTASGVNVSRMGVRKSKSGVTRSPKPLEPLGTMRPREASARAEAAKRRRDECLTCHGGGWRLDSDGQPVSKCRHERASA